MMMSDPLWYLVRSISMIVIGVMLVRFLSQLVGANPRNPVCAALRRITDHVLHPLRRVVPGNRRIDGASLTVVIGLELAYVLGAFVLADLRPSPMPALRLALVDLSLLLVNIMTASIIVEAVLSWIAPQHPLSFFSQELNAPLLDPARRLLPNLGGLDLSPVLVLLLLQFLRRALLPLALF